MTAGVDAGRADLHDDLIYAVLRGEAVAWPGADEGEAVEAFLARADYHGMLPLLDHRFRNPHIADRWPDHIVARCRSDGLIAAAWNLAQRVEIPRLLTAFRCAGVKPLLLKGVALAYTHYSQPGLRPRGDLDLLVDRRDKERGEDVLRSLGYLREGVSMGKFISHEAEWSLVDRMGAEHVVDFHWRSRNSPILARLLGYSEMEARSVSIASLGSDAFTPCPVHALLFACIHRAGHQNSPYYMDGVPFPARERLIWLYDIHLLASRMPSEELEEVASIAVRKGMAAICREALSLCQERFGLQVPGPAMQELSVVDTAEPSWRFLRGGRLRQMAGDFLAIDGAGEKLGWLLELAFPSAQYMRSKYPGKTSWLPVLYARRAFDGLKKL